VEFRGIGGEKTKIPGVRASEDEEVELKD